MATDLEFWRLYESAPKSKKVSIIWLLVYPPNELDIESKAKIEKKSENLLWLKKNSNNYCKRHYSQMGHEPHLVTCHAKSVLSVNLNSKTIPINVAAHTHKWKCENYYYYNNYYYYVLVIYIYIYWCDLQKKKNGVHVKCWIFCLCTLSCW